MRVFPVNTTPCPKCGSLNAAYILWGYPVVRDGLDVLLEKKRIVLGGCIIRADNPRWQCNECGALFGIADPK